MFKQKNIIITFSMLFFLGMIACSQQESNAETQNKINTMANADIAKANIIDASELVFDIESVANRIEGKSVNFSWLHNGNTRTFEELTKGKVVFLNFWGTWCPPCRAEIPDIIEIYNELNGNDFTVVGIAMERDANPKGTVSKYVNAAKIPYMNFIATSDIIRAYGGVQFVPTTFIIAKDGSISEVIQGKKSKEEFLQSIRRAMK